LGGDEFAIIFNGVTSAESLHASVDQIVAAIGSSIETCGTQVTVTASIGVAIGPEDASDPDVLLRNADIALSMEKDLRLALENDEPRAYYQPLVALSDNRVSGFESLMRGIPRLKDVSLRASSSHWRRKLV
jgi:GGDEF domain-containing protein